MGVRVSGGSVRLAVFAINWERTAGDTRVAHAVVAFLEDRRLLFGERHIEDEAHCVASALECRAFLTQQLLTLEPDRPLAACLKAMRASFREFVEQGGPNGQRFQQERHGFGADFFSLALGDLRGRVGEQLATIAWKYDVEIDKELARILPPDSDRDDISWLPSFGSRP